MSGDGSNLSNGNGYDVNNMNASGSQYPDLPSSGNKAGSCNQQQSSSTTGTYSYYPNTVNGPVSRYHPTTPLAYEPYVPPRNIWTGNNTAGTGTASNSSSLHLSHPSPFLTPAASASSTGNQIPPYANNAILNYLGYPGPSVASSSTNSASNLYNNTPTGPNTSAPSTGSQLPPHSNNAMFNYVGYPGTSAASSSTNSSTLNAFVSNPYNNTSAGVNQNPIIANMASTIPYPTTHLPLPPNAGGGIGKRRADQIAILKEMVKKPRGRPPKKQAAAGVITIFPHTFAATAPATAIVTAPATPIVTALPIAPSNARPTVTAKIPMPPNWLENCEDTVMSLQMYKTYAVGRDTAEYQTIVNMLQPTQVTEVEQIVNPDLWKRFVSTRTEMFRSKCDDLNILSKLSLDEREVLQCVHMSMNYNKDPLLIPYSDNMVLLFHCTRNQSNLNNILSQGLDERLSSTSGGLLGKGIYFSDDPQKSLQYDGAGSILIFAVLLGDCISVDHFPIQRTLVREPEKVAQQKRNFNDQFFDSIVARPGGHNEYVIYNRFQCCPIYKVKYNRSSSLASSSYSNFNVASQKLPPIAWIPSGPNYAMPIQDQTNWPFFAVDLFTSMGVTPPEEENADNEELDHRTDDNTPPMTIDDKLATLINLGFEDEARNREILSRFNNDIAQAVNYFLDNDVENNQPSTSTAASSSTSSLPPLPIVPSTSKKESDEKQQSVVTIDLIDDESDDEKTEANDQVTTSDSKPLEKIKIEPDLPEDIAEWALEYDPKTEMEDCPICCNDFESYETSPSSWQVLTCSHKLCLACYSKILTSRFTMSNVQHTFVKCPFCQGITGIEVGTCPDMQMTTTINPNSCKGYEPHTSFAINYSNNRFNRTAYLPHNKEGQEVLRLLQIAFDRRLCFTVGTSNTTGQENVIVWNIHHKTSLSGGVSSYGYPDPTYMDRVKWELKAYGIE